MKKELFFILALLIAGIWMVIRSFFGWWNEQSSPTFDGNTWFIEQLNETWNQNAILDDKEIIPKKNSHTTIKLLMPSYFYNIWRKNFAQDLYNDQNVYIDFSFIDNLNEYKDRLYNPNFTWWDLILLPYDRANEISTRSFSFQQNVWSVFDPLISPLFSKEKINFLPFAADPMISYILSWDNIPSNFFEISEFVYNYSPKKSLAMPLRFWITMEDFSEWFMWEYQDIVRYALLHYFTTYHDSQSLQSWIDTNVFEWYNIKNISTIVNAISESKCKDFPSICLQLYNFVWMRIWFLSDTDIVSHFFPQKKSDFDTLTQKTLPFFSIESPIRLRWRSMPSSLTDVDTINWVYLFLIKYMNDYKKYELRNSTIPVFDQLNETPLINNIFIGHRWYILQEWWNYLENLKSKRYFRQLIEYQISAKDYLKKI